MYIHVCRYSMVKIRMFAGEVHILAGQLLNFCRQCLIKAVIRRVEMSRVVTPHGWTLDIQQQLVHVFFCKDSGEHDKKNNAKNNQQQISREVSTKPLNRGLNYSITFSFRWLEAITQWHPDIQDTPNLKTIKERLKLLCRYPSHSKIWLVHWNKDTNDDFTSTTVDGR